MAGALKAKVGGTWVLASSAAGGGGAEEVYIGPTAPSLAYDLWVDTSQSGVLDAPVPWIPVTAFLNGWSNLDGSGPGARIVMYRKLGDQVFFKGLMAGGTLGAGNPAFIMPDGYRDPSSNTHHAVVAGGYAFGTVLTNSSGHVTLYNGSNGFVDLSTVYYSVTP